MITENQADAHQTAVDLLDLDWVTSQGQTTDDILMAEAIKMHINHVTQDEREDGILARRPRAAVAVARPCGHAKHAWPLAGNAKIENFGIAETRPSAKPLDHFGAARNLIEDSDGVFERAKLGSVVSHDKSLDFNCVIVDRT